MAQVAVSGACRRINLGLYEAPGGSVTTFFASQ
jgi:hypothetical protein